ncbi:MAG: small basic protein [Candidatus Omnitrophota bacterium]
MSQHPSLKSKSKEKAHRSVWKRHERLKFLSEKDKWSESDSVYGLEKIKLLRVKIKKEKAAEAAAEGADGAQAAEGAQGAAAPQAGKGEAAAKGATALAKGAAAKTAAGKEEAKGASKSDKPVKPGSKVK